MITVRFPSGFSVQYNDLDMVDIRQDGIYLGMKTAPNSYYVWAPKDCLIEHIRPCQTYNAMDKEAWNAVGNLHRNFESLKRKVTAAIKK